MAAEFSQLDQQKFNRFHLKTIVVSGIGFFTDAFDIFVINLAIPMIAFTWYFTEKKDIGKANHMPSIETSLLKASTQVGTLIGQLLFGYLADKLGRKSMYGLVLAIMIVCTFNTALAAPTVSFSIGAVLIFWRLILGIGIGGDYPISAVITSEFASVHTRGLMVAAVFAMQGLGILVASLCAIIVLAAFRPILVPDHEGTVYIKYLDNVWRLLFFLGIVPALLAVYWRLQIPETPRFTAAQGDKDAAMKDLQKVANEMGQIDGDIQLQTAGSSSAADVAIPLTSSAPVNLEDKYSHLTFGQVFGNWKNGKILFATAACWFLLDVGFYGVQLNQSDVLKHMGYGKGETAYDYFFSLALGNLILSLCGTVPGYWFTVFTIEKFGRIKIQLMGFTFLTIIFIVLTAAFDSLKGTTGFFVLFVGANFFFNFGPNSTTFILPAELFPTKFRSTCHGISAGAGKLGAIIAAFGFDQIKGKNGENMWVILLIFSVCMAAGLLCTFLIPETKGKTLEELSNLFYSPEVVEKYGPAPIDYSAKGDKDDE
ncbi:phosphate transporter [Allomyces javanicus]|nr:phosphate transporter [Allomyces javanicus]